MIARIVTLGRTSCGTKSIYYGIEMDKKLKALSNRNPTIVKSKQNFSILNIFL